MGFVSLREDIEEALLAANLVAERITQGKIPVQEADRLVEALLKRCKYIVSTMEEVKRLHSDLSHDTRNRIYTLRSERDEALNRVCELERERADENQKYEARLAMASRKIRSLKPLKSSRTKRTKKGNGATTPLRQR